MSDFNFITQQITQKLEARIASVIFYDKMEEEFHDKHSFARNSNKRSRVYTSFFKLLNKHAIKFSTSEIHIKDGVSMRFPRDYWDGEQIVLNGFSQVNPIKLYMLLGAYFNSFHYSFYDREKINFGAKNGILNEFDAIHGMMIAKDEGIEYTEDLFDFYSMPSTESNILSISEYIEPRICSLIQLGILDEDFKPTYSTFNKFLGKEMVVPIVSNKETSLVDKKSHGSYSTGSSSVMTQKALGLYRPLHKETTTIITPPDPVQKFIDFLLQI